MKDAIDKKVVCVLGGFGMVGRAVCRELLRLEKGPRVMLVTSLLEREAQAAVETLRN